MQGAPRIGSPATSATRLSTSRTAAFLLILAVSGCNETTTESYPVGVSSAWGSVTSGGYAAGSYGLVGPLAALNVKVGFQSFSDRTAHWTFTHQGEELARLNASVTGNNESTTISYRYAEGEIAGDRRNLEKAISTLSQRLIIEGVGAQVQGRPMDQAAKEEAEAKALMIVGGEIVKETAKLLTITDEQRATWRENDERAKRRIERSKADLAKARTDPALATQPTINLSAY